MTDPDRPIVGREQTLGVLMDLAKALSDGTGGVCVLAGEPGVGKTRVMRELLARARVLDCFVLHGRAQEYDSSLAYSVLKDALASLPQETLPGSVSEELSALVDSADRAVTESADDEAGRPQSPYVLTTRLLRTLTEVRPCLIAIDDAHLADGESLATLSLAVRHLSNRPLLVVFAVRSGEWLPGTAFAATVGRLVDEGNRSTIRISGLDEADTKALVGTLLDGRPDGRLVDYVYAQSRGNPLFAKETVFSLLAQGAIRNERGRLYLTGEPNAGPVSQRGALLHRIFQQDEHGRRLARVMSAFGKVRLSQLELLAELTGLSPDDLQRAFDKLTDSAVLVNDNHGTFEFSHPLMAEVLYDDLGPVERRRIHRAVADYLSANPDGRVGVLERATHAVEAASRGDRAAIAVAMQAARLTRDAAPLSAARWLSRVLDLLEPDSSEVGDVLARQARAYWKGSRPDLAVDVGKLAAMSLTPGRQRTANALTVVSAAYAMGRLTDSAALSEELTNGENASAASAAQRSLILAHLGRVEDARSLKELAWAQVDLSNPEEQAVTYSYLAMVENTLGTQIQMRVALDALINLATNDTRLAAGARLSALESWAYVGSLAEKPAQPVALAEAAESLSNQVGWQDLGGQAVMTLARTQYLHGQWDEALETIRSGSISLDFANLANNLVWLRLVEIDILLNRGDHVAAEEVLHGVHLPEIWEFWRLCRDILQARIDLARQDVTSGLESLDATLSVGLSYGLHEIVFRALDALVDFALDRDDTEPLKRIESVVRDLLSSESRKIRRAASLAMAVLEQEPAFARDVLELAAKDGSPLSIARAHYVIAVLGQDVQQNLSKAAAEFERLGARTWLKRAHALGRRLGVTVARATPPASSSKAHLADTDLQLLQFVRDGLNNREIAEAMHYSRKTVEAYLSRLYRKTGSSSRITLIVNAEKEGWLDPAEKTSSLAGP